MRDYGVQESTWRPLPWSWAQERLVANRNYWVVTVDPAGRPHSTPVWGLWHTDDTFWFSCAPSAFKARNLRANPYVAITTDSTTGRTAASITGAASIITGNSRGLDRPRAEKSAVIFSWGGFESPCRCGSSSLR